MKWFSVPIGGQVCRTDIVRNKHPVFGGEQLFGITLRDKNRVYIARDFPKETQASTALHENFGHLAFRISGVSNMLVELCEGDEEKAHEFEEEMIRKLELVWFPMFQHFGFKFPEAL